MSLHVSRVLEHDGVPLYAHVMAAMRRADTNTDNLRKLQRAFPDLCQELEKRYNTPGRLLPRDLDFIDFKATRLRAVSDVTNRVNRPSVLF